MPSVLKTERLTLRPFQASDVSSLVKVANNPHLAKNLRDRFPSPYTLQDAIAWVMHCNSEILLRNFAIEHDGDLIGAVGFLAQDDVYRKSAEVGYWLAEPFWGRGLMVEAVKAATEYGFSHLGLVRIFATVFDWNKASARVLEKAGYVLEGRMKKAVFKDNQVIDQWLYAKVLEERQSSTSAD